MFKLNYFNGIQKPQSLLPKFHNCKSGQKLWTYLQLKVLRINKYICIYIYTFVLYNI